MFSKLDANDWVTLLGIVIMIFAALFVDWRAAMFIIGLVLWADTR